MTAKLYRILRIYAMHVNMYCEMFARNERVRYLRDNKIIRSIQQNTTRELC